MNNKVYKFNQFIIERNDVNSIKELKLLSDMILDEYFNKLEKSY